jgi:hypothetical protein
MKRKLDVSLLAVLMIVTAFFMAAAVILACAKLPELREILWQRINY